MKYRSYSDILIEPQYSDLSDSRETINISCTNDILNTLSLPVMSANMKNVTGPTMVKAMYENGGMGVLHRFNTIEENVNEFKISFDMGVPVNRIGVSVGVKEEGEERFKSLYQNGANIFFIDVAHGHSILVKNMIEYIRCNSKGVIIVAGNIATAQAAKDLIEWGADILKVGIGPGSVCTTRKNTGVGVPQFDALYLIRNAIGDSVPLIADGGIRNSGDVTKALIYADYVMLGAVLAGTSETPGMVFPDDGEDLVNRTYYKIYGGSSSEATKGNQKFIEGIIKKIPFKGHVKYILKEIREGVKGGFGLVGARNISEFRDKVDVIDLEIGAKQESKLL